MNVRVVIGLEQQELVLLEAGVVLKRQDGLQGEVVVRVDKVLLENVLIDFVLLCKINNPISFSFLYLFVQHKPTRQDPRPASILKRFYPGPDP